MEYYEIEKNVPIPARGSTKGIKRERSRNFPFDEMEIGDSFFVPLEVPSPAEKYLLGLNLYDSLRNKKRRKYCPVHASFKIRVRNFSNGVRCWRIA